MLSNRSADSYVMDMPSFRMTWCASSFSEAGAPTVDERCKTRDARRARDKASYTAGKRERKHEPATQRQFFGAEARRAFFDLYAEQHRVWSQEGAPRGDELRQASARTHYLSSIVKSEGLPPLPLLINSREETPVDVVNLNGFHMGNKAVSAWAGALSRMVKQGVELTELHLKENSLGIPTREDRAGSSGLVALCGALSDCRRLRLIDMSDNDLSNGDSGKAFAGLLRQFPAEQLSELHLSRCRLGDRNATIILEALEPSISLKYLDLSSNGLGTNLTWSDDTARGLAGLLSNRKCPLEALYLSYNDMDRPEISEALAHNRHLRTLDLSWNGMGNEGVMCLANALRGNRRLEFLDLTHVEMKERGAMVMADVLKEDKTLATVLLNENPIGQRGGRAVLRAMRKMVEYQWEKDIQMFGCNYDLQEASEDLFDPAEPGSSCDVCKGGGTYELDLEDPYQRMVAWELVELAWADEGENWADETLDGGHFDLDEPEPGETWTRADWQLPGDGILRLTYRDTPDIKRFTDVVEAEMMYQLLDLMQHKMVTDYGLRLLKLASQEFWLTAEYAASFFGLMRDSESRIAATVAMLPRVVDTINISRGLLDWLTDNEYKAVEKKLGPELFHFVQGNPTGHYKLQLGNPQHRMLVNKLVAISYEETLFRKEHDMIDTSQKGDWENWRNETLNGAPYDFDEKVASEGGLDYGILEFDYVSTNISHRLIGTEPMPQQVFALFLYELQQVKLAVQLNPAARPKRKRKAGKKSGQAKRGYGANVKSNKANKNNSMMQVRASAVVPL